jgi:hypothetical protein
MPVRATTTAVVLFVLGAVAACTGSVASSSPPITPRPPTSSPGISTDVPSDRPAADAPPTAELAAEGGDAVEGQLGTYVWGDSGSDSPWLPGAPISVGAGEPLRVTVDPAVPVAAWRARFVPSDADGPDGARVIGQDAGDPSFQAPGAGSWTVEVHIEFDSDAGDASYFWRLDVT